MASQQTAPDARYNRVERCNQLLEIMRERMTNRAFDPSYVVPREHYELIIEAARHAPSGANSQPWHYIVVTDPELKQRLGERFVAEQRARADLKMKFPTPSYAGMKTAPGLVLVAVDFRFIDAFPVLNDGSELDRMYRRNAERILLQSAAASVMSAHLAAAALGYAVWWVTAIGQDAIQREFKPLLGVPEAFSIIDIMCFGPPLKPSYKRWKKELGEILNWNRLHPDNCWSDAEVQEWIKTRRHKVMYRDGSNVD